MTYISNIARSQGDPKVLRSGRSSLGAADRLARGLGWVSIGLGLAELLAPRRFTRAFGLEGNEGLVRAFGVREVGAGVLSLSVDKRTGLWSRVGGDAIDIAALLAALHPGNPRRGNVGLALAAVAGVTLLDLLGAQAVTARHRRAPGGDRLRYRDRSGFPRGIGSARTAAAAGVTKAAPEPRDVRTPV